MQHRILIPIALALLGCAETPNPQTATAERRSEWLQGKVTRLELEAKASAAENRKLAVELDLAQQSSAPNVQELREAEANLQAAREALARSENLRAECHPTVVVPVAAVDDGGRADREGAAAGMRRAAADDRATIAQSVDHQMLLRGLDPESVTTDGPGGTILVIGAAWCTRQMAFDLARSSGRLLKTGGFTALRCDRGDTFWVAEIP